MDAKHRALSEALRLGLTAGETAEILGITKRALAVAASKARARYGDRLFPPRPDVLARRRRVLDLWRQGHTAAQISEALGLPGRTVAHHLYRARQDWGDRSAPRRRGRSSPRALERRAHIVSLWRAGAPIAEICAAVGVGKSAVKSHLHKARREAGPAVVPYRRDDGPGRSGWRLDQAAALMRGADAHPWRKHLKKSTTEST